MKWTKLPTFVQHKSELYIFNCSSRRTKKEQLALKYIKQLYPDLLGKICGHSLSWSGYYLCIPKELSKKLNL